MPVVTVEDAGEFLERAAPLLLEDEARNALLLGIAGTLRDQPGAYREHHLWLVVDRSAIVAAALQTPPFNLVLGRPASAAALERLAQALHDADVDLPGLTAAVPETDLFADAWEARTGRRRRARMSQRVYAATAISPPVGVPGAHRVAADADRDLLVSLVQAFGDEALHGLESPAGDAARAVDARLAGAGGFVLWEDGGEVVSFAGWGGRTPNGVRIGPVYTPPERRGCGYGSAVTAAVSARHLDAGRRFCCLYTDLANPTSNKIYMDIGYEPVCDSVHYAFEVP